MNRSTAILIGFTTVSLVVNGARVFGEWALCWNGYIAGGLLFLSPLLLLPAALAGVMTVISAFIGLLSRFRHEAMVTMCCCLIFITTYYLAGYYSFMVRRAIYIGAAVRGTPLTGAILDYEVEHSSPPSTLSALVPRYIDQIPETGFATTPHFDYHVYGEGGREPRWELSLHRSELPNADALVFWPGGNYPGKISEGTIEKLGQWAYIHDAF